MNYDTDIKKLLWMTEKQRVKGGFPATFRDIAAFYDVPLDFIRQMGKDVVREYLEEHRLEIMMGLKDKAIDGSPGAQKIVWTYLGELIEKAEVNVGLTGDAIARANLEAERELQEWHKGESTQGVEEVQKRPPLVSN